jgi:hypothetical protein
MSKLSTVPGLSKLKMPQMGGFSLTNHFKNTNSILIVCVIILVLIALIGYKFSSCFSPCSMFGGACPKKQNTANTAKKPDCVIVTPQCILGSLGTQGAPVVVVNVLSEKMPVFIGVEQPDEQRSISKAQFETMLEANNGQVPKEVGMVVLMCAGWSCSAAKNYCDELSSRGVDVSRVVDYAGGLHEWCVYNKLNRSVFKLFHNRKESENRVAELSPAEVNELLSNTAHGYKTNTLIEADSGMITEMCKQGQALPTILVPPPPQPTSAGLPGQTTNNQNALVPPTSVNGNGTTGNRTNGNNAVNGNTGLVDANNTGNGTNANTE